MTFIYFRWHMFGLFLKCIFNWRIIALWCWVEFCSITMCVSLSHSIVSKSLRPHDCSPPGCSVHGILQARILEWVAIPFSRGSSKLRGHTWVFHFSDSQIYIYSFPFQPLSFCLIKINGDYILYNPF